VIVGDGNGTREIGSDDVFFATIGDDNFPKGGGEGGDTHGDLSLGFKILDRLP
jgi:hypothetical protein